ncbi:hypothetical protein BJX96DRAFT_57114 [Aspergillus floccosus]
MAQYPPTPPSFGSHPSNATQWLPSGLSHNTPFPQNPSHNYQPPPNGATNSFEHNNNAVNFNANTRIPGLGAAGSLPPPPPFPFFSPTQFPPVPFPGAQIPPPNYPTMPLPPATMLPLSGHASTTASQQHMGIKHNAQPEPSSRIVDDMDREEGELTDKEGGNVPLPHEPASGSRQPPLNGLGQNRSVPHVRSCRKSSELEEGEASPVRSRSSSRESGSPYNPPLSIDVAPVASPHEMDLESGDSSISRPDHVSRTTGSVPNRKADQGVSNGTKSPAQLRVQAQGALLSLAPHNIRYHELVGEGINPTVLKRLYEEIGIKIASPQPDASAASRPTHLLHSTRGSAIPADVTKERKPPSDVSTQSDGITLNETQSPSAQDEPTRPMERKEVIARMLAAKAARSTAVPGVLLAESAVQTPAEQAATLDLQKSATTSSSEESAKEKETRVKEKNRAQTELARQRIEQLKKQGLLRAQQKAQTDHVASDKAESSATATEASAMGSGSAVAIQHPLPERPPAPENQASARIPGLFMMETGQLPSHESFVTPVQGLEVDSTPQARVHQRKRPRASDFDEPIPIPKRSLSNGANYAIAEERLVIDISDDDLYDDDNESMDIDNSPESNSQDAASSHADNSVRPFTTPYPPQRSMTSSTPLYSSSATPHYSRNNDPEDLRRRDLEIQAMHRRIAELEQRKKAKLAASRTQSPRAADSSASTPGNTSMDAEITDAPSLPTRSGPIQSTVSPDQSARLSSLKPDELENMKAKLLRKEEIESGMPALDAEIQKFESKLTELKGEEGLVLLEISKGKEGRQQLLQELNDLNLELNGLTLKEVEDELQKVKLDGRPQITEEVPVGQQDIPRVHEGREIQESEADTSTQATLNFKPPSTNATASALSPTADSDVDGETDSSSDVSSTSSESEGSAMDESSDSDSSSNSEDSDSNSDSEGSEGEHIPSPRPAVPEGVHESQATAQAPLDKSATEHPLPERPPFTDIVNEANVASSNQEHDVGKTQDQAAADESSDSEAYEPPEPEATASSADSDYTPPSNPPSPGSVDAMDISQSPTEQSQNVGDLLTGKEQEGESRDAPHNGLLENPPVQESLQHKFSPYVSPLRNFNAYRYHPNYTSEVTDGYRSLTYSHNIDAMKYLCPYESAGGVCNDKSCEFQHFRDMTLSGASTT